MPLFRTKPSSSLATSIRNLIAGAGDKVSPLQEIELDAKAAETARNMSLAEKARLEAEALRRESEAAAQAETMAPQRRTEFAAHSAGIDLPDATRLYKAISGVRERPVIEYDDDGNLMPDVTYAKPENLGAGQERIFRSALAAAQANMLGSGKTTAAQLTEASGNVQTQALVQAVQDAIARGDLQTASAISQGAKPGTQIKLHENIGTTGATFAPATGGVASDPSADPGNTLLARTIAEAEAKAERDRAAASESRAKAANERAGGGQGKPPPGYRWKADGSLEAIPGGPADAKVGAEAEKARKRLDAARVKENIVVREVDKALKQTGFFTTGFIGANLGKVAGTPAYDLRKTATTIKANIGFQELQAMREASPTGGALGQVAIQELEALQSVLASIDPDQSEPQLKENLNKVKTHYENWKRAVEKSGGGDDLPKGEVQARKKIGNVEFVKINGQWFTP